MLIELFVLIGLVTLVVASLLLGKRKISEQPIVIEQAQFHATLSPRLAHLQTPLQQLHTLFLSSHTENTEKDIANLYYLETQQQFLLAVTYRAKVLYCQAIVANDTTQPLQTLQQYSQAVLVFHPLQLPLANEVELRHCIKKIFPYAQELLD